MSGAPNAGLANGLRIFRSLAWLRWRLLVNALLHAGRRDRMERLSRALEPMGPILTVLLTVPAFVALAGLGAMAGATVADPAWDSVWAVARILLAALLIAALSIPFVASGGRQLAGLRRLLLLPISRFTLFLTESASGMADPWTALAIPLALAIPAGVWWSYGPAAGLMTAAGGAIFVVLLAGVSSFCSSLLALLARNRARAELITVIAMIVLPMLGMIPGLAESRRVSSRAENVGTTAGERSPGDQNDWPGWTVALPSEMYAASVARSAGGQLGDAVLPMTGLLLWAAVFNAGSWMAFRRIYESPTASGGHRIGAPGTVRLSSFPFLSSPAAAVAAAQIRLVLRSPRGRTCLIGPLLMLVIFGILMWGGRDGPAEWIRESGGLGLATVVAFFSLLAMHPIIVNQFAADGAGLTLQLLLPLTNRDLLIGKVASGAVISILPTVLVLVLAFAAFPGGPLSLWAALPLGLMATYAVIAPLAAAMSVLFPRAVNLNAMGRQSNPHQAASFVTTFATLAAAAIPVGLGVAAVAFGVPYLGLVLMLTWLILTVIVGYLLLGPVEHVLDRRRENLAIVAGST